ncbi:sensor histidine kinase [Propionibacteriaceae bacterium Y2011]
MPGSPTPSNPSQEDTPPGSAAALPATTGDETASPVAAGPVAAGQVPWGREVNRVLVWSVPILLALYYLTPTLSPNRTAALVVLSIVPPLLAIAALLVRRRQPIAVALVVGVLLVLSPGVVGAAVLAQASVARHVKRVATVLLTGCWLVAAKLVGLVFSPFGDGWTTASSFELIVAVAGLVIGTLLGWLAGSREAESRSRGDASRAQHEAELARLEQARLAERDRIAREMHDVLAHRLSLVAMHSGVLAHRADLTPDEQRETARLIQSNAKQSLAELRTVLSTLRGADAPPEPPQPSLADVTVLVADVTEHQPVHLDVDLDVAIVPTRLSRHAYRIVQEGLTNARKHAPGAPVEVKISGAPGVGVDIMISNPLTELAAPNDSGAGFGLIGVAERAADLTGTARYGVVADRHVLDVSLPWQDPT